MATTITNYTKKKIVSDTLPEIMQAIQGLGNQGKVSVSTLNNGKYFATIESAPVSPTEDSNVYDSNVIIQILENNTTLRMYAVSGEINWGDGTKVEITSSMKDTEGFDLGLTGETQNPAVIRYGNCDEQYCALLTHTYNKGIYTLGFSSDFRLLRNPWNNIRNNEYWQAIVSVEGMPEGYSLDNDDVLDCTEYSLCHFEWPSSCKILSITGSLLKDLDYPSSITDLSLGNDITEIEVGALSGLSLNHITLPESIEYIENYAFGGNIFLKDIDISRNNNLIIGQFAFAGCPITEITLPEGISFTHNNSFGYNSFNLNEQYHSMLSQYPILGVRIKTLILKDTTPNINVLENCAGSLEEIYVPYSQDHSVLNAYKAAQGWSSYANIIFESNPE